MKRFDGVVRVFEDVRIRLVSDDKLYFEPVNFYAEDELKVLDIIKAYPDGASFDEIKTKARVGGRTKMYTILKSLEKNKVITKGKRDNEGSKRLTVYREA